MKALVLLTFLILGTWGTEDVSRKFTNGHGGYQFYHAEKQNQERIFEKHFQKKGTSKTTTELDVDNDIAENVNIYDTRMNNPKEESQETDSRKRNHISIKVEETTIDKSNVKTRRRRPSRTKDDETTDKSNELLKNSSVRRIRFPRRRTGIQNHTESKGSFQVETTEVNKRKLEDNEESKGKYLVKDGDVKIKNYTTVTSKNNEESKLNECANCEINENNHKAFKSVTHEGIIFFNSKDSTITENSELNKHLEVDQEMPNNDARDMEDHKLQESRNIEESMENQNISLIKEDLNLEESNSFRKKQIRKIIVDDSQELKLNEGKVNEYQQDESNRSEITNHNHQSNNIANTNSSTEENDERKLEGSKDDNPERKGLHSRHEETENQKSLNGKNFFSNKHPEESNNFNNKDEEQMLQDEEHNFKHTKSIQLVENDKLKQEADKNSKTFNADTHSKESGKAITKSEEQLLQDSPDIIPNGNSNSEGRRLRNNEMKGIKVNEPNSRESNDFNSKELDDQILEESITYRTRERANTKDSSLGNQKDQRGNNKNGYVLDEDASITTISGTPRRNNIIRRNNNTVIRTSETANNSNRRNEKIHQRQFRRRNQRTTIKPKITVIISQEQEENKTITQTSGTTTYDVKVEEIKSIIKNSSVGRKDGEDEDRKSTTQNSARRKDAASEESKTITKQFSNTDGKSTMQNGVRRMDGVSKENKTISQQFSKKVGEKNLIGSVERRDEKSEERKSITLNSSGEKEESKIMTQDESTGNMERENTSIKENNFRGRNGKNPNVLRKQFRRRNSSLSASVARRDNETITGNSNGNERNNSRRSQNEQNTKSKVAEVNKDNSEENTTPRKFEATENAASVSNHRRQFRRKLARPRPSAKSQVSLDEDSRNTNSSRVTRNRPQNSPKQSSKEMNRDEDPGISNRRRYAEFARRSWHNQNHRRRSLKKILNKNENLSSNFETSEENLHLQNVHVKRFADHSGRIANQFRVQNTSTEGKTGAPSDSTKKENVKINLQGNEDGKGLKDEVVNLSDSDVTAKIYHQGNKEETAFQQKRLNEDSKGLIKNNGGQYSLHDVLEGSKDVHSSHEGRLRVRHVSDGRLGKADILDIQNSNMRKLSSNTAVGDQERSAVQESTDSVNQTNSIMRKSSSEKVLQKKLSSKQPTDDQGSSAVQESTESVNRTNSITRNSSSERVLQEKLSSNQPADEQASSLKATSNKSEDVLRETPEIANQRDTVTRKIFTEKVEEDEGKFNGNENRSKELVTQKESNETNIASDKTFYNPYKILKRLNPMQKSTEQLHSATEKLHTSTPKHPRTFNFQRRLRPKFTEKFGHAIETTSSKIVDMDTQRPVTQETSESKILETRSHQFKTASGRPSEINPHNLHLPINAENMNYEPITTSGRPININPHHLHLPEDELDSNKRPTRTLTVYSRNIYKLNSPYNKGKSNQNFKGYTEKPDSEEGNVKVTKIPASILTSFSRPSTERISDDDVVTEFTRSSLKNRTKLEKSSPTESNRNGEVTSREENFIEPEKSNNYNQSISNAIVNSKRAGNFNDDGDKNNNESVSSGAIKRDESTISHQDQTNLFARRISNGRILTVYTRTTRAPLIKLEVKTNTDHMIPKIENEETGQIISKTNHKDVEQISSKNIDPKTKNNDQDTEQTKLGSTNTHLYRRRYEQRRNKYTLKLQQNDQIQSSSNRRKLYQTRNNVNAAKVTEESTRNIVKPVGNYSPNTGIQRRLYVPKYNRNILKKGNNVNQIINVRNEEDHSRADPNKNYLLDKSRNSSSGAENGSKDQVEQSTDEEVNLETRTNPQSNENLQGTKNENQLPNTKTSILNHNDNIEREESTSRLVQNESQLSNIFLVNRDENFDKTTRNTLISKSELKEQHVGNYKSILIINGDRVEETTKNIIFINTDPAKNNHTQYFWLSQNKDILNKLGISEDNIGVINVQNTNIENDNLSPINLQKNYSADNPNHFGVTDLQINDHKNNLQNSNSKSKVNNSEDNFNNFKMTDDENNLNNSEVENLQNTKIEDNSSNIRITNLKNSKSGNNLKNLVMRGLYENSMRNQNFILKMRRMGNDNVTTTVSPLNSAKLKRELYTRRPLQRVVVTSSTRVPYYERFFNATRILRQASTRMTTPRTVKNTLFGQLKSTPRSDLPFLQKFRRHT